MIYYVYSNSFPIIEPYAVAFLHSKTRFKPTSFSRYSYGSRKPRPTIDDRAPRRTPAQRSKNNNATDSWTVREIGTCFRVAAHPDVVVSDLHVLYALSELFEVHGQHDVVGFDVTVPEARDETRVQDVRHAAVDVRVRQIGHDGVRRGLTARCVRCRPETRSIETREHATGPVFILTQSDGLHTAVLERAFSDAATIRARV